MKLFVNGQARDVAEGTTLVQLLAEMQIPRDHLVIEHNGDILEGDASDSMQLRDGDTLELVRFVGGG